MFPRPPDSGRFDTVLFWFRRDLRLTDNRGLTEATFHADRVIPVFVFDTNILDMLDNERDRRVTFIHETIAEMQRMLREIGSDLVVLHGDPIERIPELADEADAGAVFTNRDYDPYSRQRDSQVHTALTLRGRAFFEFKDQVIYERDEIVTQSGDPYKVFTPYMRAWQQRLEGEERFGYSPVAIETPAYESLAPGRSMQHLSDSWKLKDLGFAAADLWLEAGENAAQQRLRNFLERIDRYREDRDYPAREATSGLSVHLRFGTISIRELVRAARSKDSEGARTWLTELIWREFYQMILDRFPYVVSHSFRVEYDSIVWPGKEEHFHAWCEGRTGYPIVDAAMRHFNATGWMHNRLRMVVAMFLTKDLLVDWRLGEGYFAENLLDYDLASNNGGWQWSASTGADGVPYFRVFNPVLQSRRFDPDGAFIRAQLPELRRFSDDAIHWPHDTDTATQRKARCVIGRDYPHPIVNHAAQKEKAIALFRRIPTT